MQQCMQFENVGLGLNALRKEEHYVGNEENKSLFTFIIFITP